MVTSHSTTNSLFDCCLNKSNSYFSYETVRLQVNEFKRGRKIINDAPRPRTLKSAVTMSTISFSSTGKCKCVS